MHERMSGALNALYARLIAWFCDASSGRGGVDVGRLSRSRDGRHVVEMHERRALNALLCSLDRLVYDYELRSRGKEEEEYIAELFPRFSFLFIIFDWLLYNWLIEVRSDLRKEKKIGIIHNVFRAPLISLMHYSTI